MNVQRTSAAKRLPIPKLSFYQLHSSLQIFTHSLSKLNLIVRRQKLIKFIFRWFYFLNNVLLQMHSQHRLVPLTSDSPSETRRTLFSHFPLPKSVNYLKLGTFLQFYLNSRRLPVFLIAKLLWFRFPVNFDSASKLCSPQSDFALTLHSASEPLRMLDVLIALYNFIDSQILQDFESLSISILWNRSPHRSRRSINLQLLIS